MTIIGNTVQQFQGTAFVVKDSQQPAHVFGNSAISSDLKANVVDVQGASGIVEQNVLRKEQRRAAQGDTK